MSVGGTDVKWERRKNWKRNRLTVCNTKRFQQIKDKNDSRFDTISMTEWFDKRLHYSKR